MNILKILLIVGLVLGLFVSFNLINDTSKYEDSTEEFVESLLDKNYDKCISLMATNHEIAKSSNIDTLKLMFLDFRQTIVNNFGEELEYTFIKTDNNQISFSDNSLKLNTTIAYIEFNNKKNLSVFEVVFDNNTNKIINIQISNFKTSIPKMTYFWLFGLLAICIPIFNIYVIVLIKRSDLKKKWLKYIMVIFLNVPSLTYMAVNGLSFKLLNFQFLMGVSFNLMGFINSYISIGIPIGGLYWFWNLYKNKEIYPMANN